MSKLSDLRTKYPQYSDMSDQEFADAFYTKFYSDMPRGEYDANLGITPKGFMDTVRSDGVMSAVGDYAKGTYENMTDPQQWKDALWRGSHDSQGRNIGEQLMDPMSGVQAVGDQAAIAGDTISAGLYPKMIDAFTGTTSQTDLVKQAEERAGTAGTGMKMATVAALPSAAARSTAGPIGRALAFGAEGAGMSGADTVLRGGDSRDILASMALGGGLSAGTSALASRFVPDVDPLTIERGEPRYPDDKSMLDDIEVRGRKYKEDRDLHARGEKLKDLRISATKGKPGLQDLDKRQSEANAAAKGYGEPEPYPYAERLMTSKVAHEADPKGFLGGTAHFAGNVLKAGGLPLSWLTKGLSAVGAAGLDEGVRAAMSKGGRKQVDAIADYLRNSGSGKLPTTVSPELANQLRDYVAKSMRTSGSKR
jgi:hypothetical protein